MGTLSIIGLVLLGIILIIGFVRVLTAEYTGFMNFLMEIMLLDYLGDAIVWVFSAIGDIIDND